MDDSVRQLLTERLPSPPPEMAEPPLAAIRRRARRRAGTQVGLAVAAVAVIAAGTAVWAVNGDTAHAPATGRSSVADSAAPTSEPAGMLYPTYLPPGFQEVGGGSETELRYLDPSDEPQIPLVIRRLPSDTRIPADQPPIRSVTVRGHTAEVFLIEDGVALTWLENASRFSVSFEEPPNAQIKFAIDETVNKLTAVADGLRPTR